MLNKRVERIKERNKMKFIRKKMRIYKVLGQNYQSKRLKSKSL